MANRPFPRPLSRVARQFGLALLVACGWAAGGFAQTVVPGEGPVQGMTAAPPLNYVGGATSTLCGSCGGGGCSSCATGCGGCGEEGCYPGREGCSTCEGQGRLGRLFCAFHNALCCPDPCYRPRWNDTANAAFFVDSARTTTMTRIRWDAGRNLVDPDRAGYFWGQLGGPGPAGPAPARVDYHELHLYQEFGGDKFSAFIDLPYRNSTGGAVGAGGIGDLAIGTKTMFLDSELLQMTFQFRTTFPTGGAGGGVGIGSVSLEPSVLTTVKLYNETYWQSQVSYWFAVGTGNGSVFHWHNSLNRVIARPLPDAALIGTFEMIGWTFGGGSVTGTDGVVRSATGTVYYSVGPGLRFAICDKLDLGIGMQFAVTDRHFAQQLYRTELRWRF